MRWKEKLKNQYKQAEMYSRLKKQNELIAHIQQLVTKAKEKRSSQNM